MKKMRGISKGKNKAHVMSSKGAVKVSSKLRKADVISSPVAIK